MSKIALIIEREYMSRVRKRSFLIMTFLTPLLFAAVAFTPLWLSKIESGEKKQVVVIDQTGLYQEMPLSNENYEFTVQQNRAADTLHATPAVYAMVVITEKLSNGGTPATIYSETQIPAPLKNHIQRSLEEIARNERLNDSGIENIREIINQTSVSLNIPSVRWDSDANQHQGSSEMAMMVGYISMFLIYMFIFIYGTQVMRGVMEEKASRIVEVMISSVKPFELMMGKIVGIALVGLTQFLLWVILSGSIIIGISTTLEIASGATTDPNLIALGGNGAYQSTLLTLLSLLGDLKWVQLLLMFLIYFTGGYLLYAALFAAIGSVIDSETDTQQFVMPITIPIIFAIYAAIYAGQNPDGPLAFWCSIIPFTSPIVMMVRLPYGVAWWEIFLSLSLLYTTFIGATYLCARVYRVGILMYGKKITWKELVKWIQIR